MSLADDVEEYVKEQLAKGGMVTAVGTVVTSPSQVSTDPLTVVLDGSALAVPVKQFRGFPVFPGMRVGLVLMGSDWVLIGAFTNPGAGTGEMRMAVGADTPPELKLYGIEVAFLFYDTDKTSGLEVGYFFIGISNELDAGANEKVMLFGAVKYPTPGDPSSPTMSDVNTAHQINLNGETWFKDFPVIIQTTVPLMQLMCAQFSVSSADTFFRGANIWFGRQPLAQNVVFDDKAALWVHNRLLTTSEEQVNLNGTLVQTISVATNTLLAGTLLNIEKKLDITRQRVTIAGSCFTNTTAPLVFDYGVRINAVDYDVGTFGHSLINDHKSFGPMSRILAAIPAGDYTCQAYVRGVAAKNLVFNGDDVFHMRWEEIY